MYFEQEIDKLLEDLSANEGLCDIRFVKGFPNCIKATIQKGVVATLSPSGLDMESVSVDNQDFYGQYSIDIDVFSPFEQDGKAVLENAEKIVRACLCDKIVGIKIGTVSPNEKIRCYTAKITLVYTAGYKMGGQNGTASKG